MLPFKLLFTFENNVETVHAFDENGFTDMHRDTCKNN